MMAQIYETKNFTVEAYEKPFVTRTDGGHIRIKVKDEEIFDRTKLSPERTIFNCGILKVDNFSDHNN